MLDTCARMCETRLNCTLDLNQMTIIICEKIFPSDCVIKLKLPVGLNFNEHDCVFVRRFAARKSRTVAIFQKYFYVHFRILIFFLFRL